MKLKLKPYRRSCAQDLGLKGLSAKSPEQSTRMPGSLSHSRNFAEGTKCVHANRGIVERIEGKQSSSKACVLWEFGFIQAFIACDVHSDAAPAKGQMAEGVLRASFSGEMGPERGCLSVCLALSLSLSLCALPAGAKHGTSQGEAAAGAASCGHGYGVL